MEILLTVLFFVILLSLCIVILLSRIFDMAFAPKRKAIANFRRVPNAPQYKKIEDLMLSHIDKLSSKTFEEINITSYDGLKLFGRYYKREKENVIKIDFHGYRGHPYRDFCGNSIINDKFGISSILIDERSHGNSEGKAICFGIKERYDVVSWVNYAVGRFGNDVKIILSGVSMGAATVLMASELELPKNVVGIIADCPYSSPRAIITRVAQAKNINGKLIFPAVKLSARLFAGIDIDASSPVEAVKHTNIPILIIHGDDDRYVPHSMGKEVFDACASENKVFFTVPDAGHALCYLTDPDGYTSTVKKFLDSIL